MSCDDFCSLRKEVVQTGEGVWQEVTLASGETFVARPYRYTPETRPAGPVLLFVEKSNPDEIREVFLTEIRGMRAVAAE